MDYGPERQQGEAYRHDYTEPDHTSDKSSLAHIRHNTGWARPVICPCRSLHHQ